MNEPGRMSGEEKSSGETEESPGSGVLEKTGTKADHPRLYKVILVNDHYTTMDFVVRVLVTVFHKTEAEARRIMFAVHKQGQGLCGVYTRDIALTKTDEVLRLARKNEFPLRCLCEPE